MTVTHGAAERMVDHILYSINNDGRILSVAIIDAKGNILSAKSTPSFEEKYGIARDGDGYGGALAIAALSVVNQVKVSFGEPQAIISVHKDCKLMLLILPAYDLLVGIVLERWADADDDKMTNNIERAVADTVGSEIDLNSIS